MLAPVTAKSLAGSEVLVWPSASSNLRRHSTTPSSIMVLRMIARYFPVIIASHASGNLESAARTWTSAALFCFCSCFCVESTEGKDAECVRCRASIIFDTRSVRVIQSRQTERTRPSDRSFPTISTPYSAICECGECMRDTKSQKSW